MERYRDDAATPAVVESLIRAQFEEPDDEHYQVAIGHGDQAVTVYGPVIFDDMREMQDGQPPPELCRRTTSRAEAVHLLTLMARGEVEAVRAAGWVSRHVHPVIERAQ